MTDTASPGLRWITKPQEMLSIRRAGRLYRGKHLYVWVLSGAKTEELPAVAVVTGRGFSGASRRNLAKRRVRGSVLDTRHLLKAEHLYLVEGRPGADKVDYQLLVDEITEATAGT